jgi:hypothetical protein
VELVTSTFLPRQDVLMYIRNDRLSICNRRFGIRDPHVGINPQLSLEGNC